MKTEFSPPGPNARCRVGFMFDSWNFRKLCLRYSPKRRGTLLHNDGKWGKAKVDLGVTTLLHWSIVKYHRLLKYLNWIFVVCWSTDFHQWHCFLLQLFLFPVNRLFFLFLNHFHKDRAQTFLLFNNNESIPGAMIFKMWNKVSKTKEAYNCCDVPHNLRQTGPSFIRLFQIKDLFHFWHY